MPEIYEEFEKKITEILVRHVSVGRDASDGKFELHTTAAAKEITKLLLSELIDADKKWAIKQPHVAQ